MAKDYTQTLARAKAMIRKYGREIVLLRFDTSVANVLKPWDGPVDPRAGGATTTSLYAVPVPPSDDNELGECIKGDLIKLADTIWIAEVGEDDPDNLGLYHEVIDGTARHSIQSVEKLKPADLTLLYFILTKR